LALRLPPEQAVKVSAAAVENLCNAIVKPTDADRLSDLAHAVGLLASHLPRAEAAAAVPKLLDASGNWQPPPGGPLSAFARAIGALAARLPPEEAGKVAAPLVRKLRDAMTKEDSQNIQEELATALWSLAAHLPPEEAAAESQQFLDAVAKATDSGTQHYLASAVRLLAFRLPPEGAAAESRKLLDLMDNRAAMQPAALSDLAVVVEALASRLPPEDARKVLVAAVEKLLAALAKTTDPSALASLADMAQFLASRLSSEDAGRVAATAAPKLLDAMAKTIKTDELQVLAATARKLLIRLPPKDAARVGRAAAQTLLDSLTRPGDLRGWSRAGAGDTGMVRYPWPSTLGPLAPWLGTEALVILLKQPLCVGPYRQSLVAELGRRLGPPAPQIGAATTAAAAAAPSPLTLAVWAGQGEAFYPGGRRPFADLWEAVDWLREHHPELDLGSPPSRVLP
jgi:hypothetical protein